MSTAPKVSAPPVDPVSIFDAMWEAGTSLMGSYVWLADHASSTEEAGRWWDEYGKVITDREAIDARDIEAQRAATADFVARERAIRHLVKA